MKRLTGNQRLARLRWRQGQTMVEYAMILATIAVVIFALYQKIGTPIQTMLNSAAALF